MSRVVLDHDDVRRTLMRIAHEIVEKTPDGRVAIVGIHRRGAVLAKRLHTLTSELLDSEVPLGSVDIAVYREDLSSPPLSSTAATASCRSARTTSARTSRLRYRSE